MSTDFPGTRARRVPARRHLAALGVAALVGAGAANSVSNESAAPVEAEEVAASAPAAAAHVLEERPAPVVVDDRLIRSVARQILFEQQQPADLTNLDLVARDVLARGPVAADDVRRVTEETLLGFGPGGPGPAPVTQPEAPADLGPAPVVPAPEPAPAPCPPTARACIDVDGKTAWLQEDGRMTYGPVPITTGRPGYETTRGTHTVLRHVRDDHSRLFDSPMPFSTYFTVGGMAFHQGRLDEPSHGCIHLGQHAAEHFFGQLRVGDEIVAF